MTVALLALVIVLLACIFGGVLFLCGIGLRIVAALSEEGFESSETALETGFLPIFTLLRNRLSFLRTHPSGRVAKF